MATPERFAADFLTAAETGWKDVHSPEYDADPRAAKIAQALRAAGVTQAHVLGSGSFGLAAAMQDGRVVKLTTDESEVAAGHVLLGRQLRHVAHVYGAWFVRGVHVDRWDVEAAAGAKGRVGLLITERVAPLDYKVDAKGEIVGQGAEVSRVWKDIRRRFGASPESLALMTHAESRKILRLASKQLESELRYLADTQQDPIAHQVADALRELRGSRVYSIDVHAGNIGYSHQDGVFKVFDIGSSSSPAGEKPPELPHVSRMTRGGMVEEGLAIEEIGEEVASASAAEDVIRLDRDAVYRGAERVVEAYARVLKRVPFDKGAEAVRTWFQIEASMVEGEPTVEGASMTPFYDYPGDLKDVRGNEIEVRVMRLLVLREQNYGLIVDAFTQAVKRGRAANIWIRINLGSPEIEKLRDQPELFVPRFASIFLHELTHVRDVIKMGHVVAPEDNREAYYNSDHEVRAYGRQIVEDVIIQARFNRDVRLAPTNEQLVERALANSQHWLQVEPWLTDENKEKIYRFVYRGLEREGLFKRSGSMRLPRTQRSRAAEDASDVAPLPFALVRVGDDVLPVLLGDGLPDPELLSGVDFRGELRAFGASDIVGLVNAEPAAVYYGVRAEVHEESMRMAAEAGQLGVKKGDTILQFPGIKARKGMPFKVRPRGERFQWTPEKPRGLTAFPEVKKVLMKQREGVPSLESIRMAAIFAGLTVHAGTSEAEDTFGRVVAKYKALHGAMPPVEEIQQIIGTHLPAARLRMYETVLPWAVIVQDAMKRGLRDRELRRHIWVDIADEDQVENIGLAKMSFAFMLMGQNMCCLDSHILGGMAATKPWDPNDPQGAAIRRRDAGDRISGLWKWSPAKKGRELGLRRYEQLEDALIKGNPWHESGPLDRAQTQWQSWEFAIGIPAAHRVWLEVTKELQTKQSDWDLQQVAVPF